MSQSTSSVDALRECLAFRHVLHNMYGCELDQVRITPLVDRYPAAWRQVAADIRQFVNWLEALADQLEQP